MVSFVSLFLGLVVGYQTVTVKVADPVESVEILIDGRAATVIEGPPWQGGIDFGPALVPHELVAVAYDGDGRELDRARQWVNLPRPLAEITLLLEQDADTGGSVVQVSWESLTGEAPSRVRAIFDGRPLAVEDPRSIPLPDYDPAELHFLRVEMEFGGILASSAEITFGGTYTDNVNTELTAFPIRFAGRKKRQPTTESLQSVFSARGQPLRVTAVEKGQVEMLIVRDRGAWEALRRVMSEVYSRALNSNTTGFQRRSWFRPDREAWQKWAFQFIWPVARRHDMGDGPYDLFSNSAKLSGGSASLHGWLVTFEQPPEYQGSQRLADAVAIAGVAAAGTNRRRGVLLVLGGDPEDSSEVRPDRVRHYLASLGVPLFVWTTHPDTSGSGPWGEAVDVSNSRLLQRATGNVLDALERQRIVWLDGIHLPQQIEVDPRAETIEAFTRPAQADSLLPAADSDDSESDVILGRPSSIVPPTGEQDTVQLAPGARIRRQPRKDAAVLEIVTSATELLAMERRGPWVRVQLGSWQGWVDTSPDDPSRRSGIASPTEPDAETLARARELLGTEATQRALGPFVLYTDVGDERLLQWLSAIAEDVVSVYGSRYELETGSEFPETVVLFSDEDDYRRLQKEQPRLAQTHSEGFSRAGLSALYAGSKPHSETASVLVHELTHLLNRRVFGAQLAPWLEEGLAEDLAYSRIDERGRLELGSLGGELRTTATGALTWTGPLAHLSNLLSAWYDPRRPSLSELPVLDRDEFLLSELRPLLYAESAFLVRLLLEDQDPGLGDRFRGYLEEIAASELAVTVPLWETLGRDPDTLEAELFLYLNRQASAHDLPRQR